MANTSAAVRQLIRPILRTGPACSREQGVAARTFTIARRSAASESRLPAVANPSFWSSLVPKAFRSSERSSANTQPVAARSKEWNPYTIFIVLGILVGGNAIQIISLRKEMLNFSRKTDARLSLLREVVQRVKAGEDVDVAGLLGTGDPKQEAEWEEVMKELEETDMLEEGRKKKAAKREQKLRASREAETERREGGGSSSGSHADENDTPAVASRRPKFLM